MGRIRGEKKSGESLMELVLLGVGGAAGALSPYFIGLLFMKKYPHPYIPSAMLIVNLTGSLGLGLFFGSVYDAIPTAAYDGSLYLLLGIGFFGAFTTFSTFSMELIELIRKKFYKKAILYFSLSIFGSIGFFLIGFIVGK